MKHADVYQLLAYLVATGLSGGMLLYASGESEPAVHEVLELGRTIEVTSLDLTLPPAGLLGELDRVAGRFRAWREVSDRRTAPPAPKFESRLV